MANIEPQISDNKPTRCRCAGGLKFGAVGETCQTCGKEKWRIFTANVKPPGCWRERLADGTKLFCFKAKTNGRKLTVKLSIAEIENFLNAP